MLEKEADTTGVGQQLMKTTPNSPLAKILRAFKWKILDEKRFNKAFEKWKKEMFEKEDSTNVIMADSTEDGFKENKSPKADMFIEVGKEEIENPSEASLKQAAEFLETTAGKAAIEAWDKGNRTGKKQNSKKENLEEIKNLIMAI